MSDGSRPTGNNVYRLIHISIKDSQIKISVLLSNSVVLCAM